MKGRKGRHDQKIIKHSDRPSRHTRDRSALILKHALSRHVRAHVIGENPCTDYKEAYI